MQRGTIKTTFGGEVPFTKFIADDQPTQQRHWMKLNENMELTNEPNSPQP